MNFGRQRTQSYLVKSLDFLSFGKIGWGLLASLLILCIIGYLAIIREFQIVFIGPIPWFTIITETGKSYLSLFMDLVNGLFGILNLSPIFDSKITNIMIAIGNAAIITLYISIFSFIFGFFVALLLAVILVTPKNIVEQIIGSILWSFIFSLILLLAFEFLGDLIIFGPILSFTLAYNITIGNILAILFGIIIGIFVGVKTGIKSLTRAYIDFFRSTPLLVQMFIVFFGFPLVFTGPEFRFIFQSTTYEINAAIIALGLNTAAYQAEIIRSGILAIPIGQTEASRGLGFSTRQTMQYIIIPQALRMIIPPLTNEGINVILNSSLASVISAREIIRVSGFLVISYFEPFLIFGVAAIFYFVMAFSLAKLTQRMEKKYRIPGLGVVHD
ncbi:MAG: amino acid ABC transporter permease [Candidatus Hodarchaeales archaeon]|jgi:His/Glu/Gln/Arg/opine family amino acid ABC transporter permease subunit